MVLLDLLLLKIQALLLFTLPAEDSGAVVDSSVAEDSRRCWILPVEDSGVVDSSVAEDCVADDDSSSLKIIVADDSSVAELLCSR